MCIKVKIWLTLTRPLTNYGQITRPKLKVSKFFSFYLIFHQNLGKVAKFKVIQFTTSDVIMKGSGGVKMPTQGLWD